MKALILVISVCILFSCLTSQDDKKEKTYTVTLKSNAEVEISPDFKECSRDSDCVLVGSVCNHCCEQQAINLAFQSTYNDKFSAACANYSGGVCDCIMQKSTAKCIDRKCLVVVDSATPYIR